MPVPTFLTVPAHAVRGTDDILVNPASKELDEHGEPMPITHTDVGQKWVYLKLAEPMGRKGTIQVGYNDGVPVLRMEDTYEDKLDAASKKIVTIALEAQRNYWKNRQRLSRAAAGVPKVQDRSWRWRDSAYGVSPEANAESLANITDELKRQEVSVWKWEDVRQAADNHEVTLAEALVIVVEKARDDLLGGWGKEELDALRAWYREARFCIVAKSEED